MLIYQINLILVSTNNERLCKITNDLAKIESLFVKCLSLQLDVMQIGSRVRVSTTRLLLLTMGTRMAHKIKVLTILCAEILHIKIL